MGTRRADEGTLPEPRPAAGEAPEPHVLVVEDDGETRRLLVRFLRERVRENPGALQVLLAFGEYGAPLVSPYSAALDSLKADGARAVLVVLPKLDRTACFWHPSADDHAMIRDQILAAILAAGES